MSNEVVWKSNSAKIIKVAEKEYEVYALTTRNEDGIVVKNWNFICVYTNSYSRDWMGRVFNVHYNPENRSDFAYSMALELAQNL